MDKVGSCTLEKKSEPSFKLVQCKFQQDVEVTTIALGAIILCKCKGKCFYKKYILSKDGFYKPYGGN